MHNAVINEITSISHTQTSSAMPDALAIFLKPTDLFFWNVKHKGEKTN